MVPNHPNRSKNRDRPDRNPDPEEVLAAREMAGLSQADAARLIYSTQAAWARWEMPKNHPDRRPMHPAFWELWKLKVSKLSRST